MEHVWLSNLQHCVSQEDFRFLPGAAGIINIVDTADCTLDSFMKMDVTTTAVSPPARGQPHVASQNCREALARRCRDSVRHQRHVKVALAFGCSCVCK
jgi:hypothetical protein